MWQQKLLKAKTDCPWKENAENNETNPIKNTTPIIINFSF